MKEIKRDLFSFIHDSDVDAICITTNGNYTMQGIACMGGGCAGEAAKRWPSMAKRLGFLLKKFNSNVPYIIGAVNRAGDNIELIGDNFHNKKYDCLVFSFPTINNLIDGANLQLIKQSATIMMDFADNLKLNKIISARLGTGIGGLNWHNEVKPAISSILDDRFTIVSFDHED